MHSSKCGGGKLQGLFIASCVGTCWHQQHFQSSCGGMHIKCDLYDLAFPGVSGYYSDAHNKLYGGAKVALHKPGIDVLP